MLSVMSDAFRGEYTATACVPSGPERRHACGDSQSIARADMTVGMRDSFQARVDQTGRQPRLHLRITGPDRPNLIAEAATHLEKHRLLIETITFNLLLPDEHRYVMEIVARGQLDDIHATRLLIDSKELLPQPAVFLPDFSDFLGISLSAEEAEDAAALCVQVSLGAHRLLSNHGGQAAPELIPSLGVGPVDRVRVHFPLGSDLPDGTILDEAEPKQLDPELLLAAWHAGWTAEQIERLDVAEAAYRRCLATTPRAPHERQSWREARFRLGALRYRARDHDEAASLMRAVIADEPAHPRAHYYLGQALVRSGRAEEGRRHLSRHDEIARTRQRGGSVASVDSR